MHKIRKSFTLVELIVVVVILVVLSVIGFISVSNRIGKSRDSKRLSDLRVVFSALNMNFTEKGYLPRPSNSVLISLTGAMSGNLAYQGSFDKDVISELGTVGKVPLDPTNSKYYNYSVLMVSGKGYEIGGYLENNKLVFNYYDAVFANQGLYPYILYYYNIGDFTGINLPYVSLVDQNSGFINNFVNSGSSIIIDASTKSVVGVTGTDLTGFSNIATAEEFLNKPLGADNDCAGTLIENAQPNVLRESSSQERTYSPFKGICTYNCKDNYVYISGSCVPAQRLNQPCTGLPTNASWNNVSSIDQAWNGALWSPSLQGTYSVTGSSVNCLFNCNSSYHYELSQCIYDTKQCTVSNGSGQNQWIDNARSNCKAVSCIAGYHIESDICLPNQKSCTITNGVGQQTWSSDSRGVCTVISCTSGYINYSNSCQIDADGDGVPASIDCRDSDANIINPSSGQCNQDNDAYINKTACKTFVLGTCDADDTKTGTNHCVNNMPNRTNCSGGQIDYAGTVNGRDPYQCVTLCNQLSQGGCCMAYNHVYGPQTYCYLYSGSPQPGPRDGLWATSCSFY